MNKLFFTFLLSFFAHHYLTAQSLTIAECQTLGKANFPLIRQGALIDRTKDFSLENLQKAYLPQVTLSGQATYQSAVTQVAVPNVKPLSKDQYKIFAEAYQPLTENSNIQQQKALLRANADIEKQKVEVEMFKLRERINQLFFGIILLDAQIAQIDLLKKDLNVGIEKAKAAIANGTALKSSVDILAAEQLKTEQRKIEFRANRRAYLEMLGFFLGKNLDENTTLSTPEVVTIVPTINRPELRLLETQKSTIVIQEKLIQNKNIPKIGLFLQTGIARPALNFLKNDFEGYYIGGVRAGWNLTNFYTNKKEREILKTNLNAFDIQKEVFLLNTNISLSQQNSEVRKYEELLKSDREIIELREKIKQVAKNQLENGTLTANDYLTQVNAEDQARQNLLLHQIQLLFAQYTAQNTAGN